MNELLNSLRKAALGDYSIRIESDSGDGDWNELCHTVNRLLENMQATIERQKQTEKLLNNIIDQNPYSLWISDDKGTFLRGNQACYRLFNTCEEELVDKYSIANDNIIEEKGFTPLIRSVFEEGKTVQFTLEYDTAELTQIDLQQKTRVYIDVTISPIKDENGVITNAIIVHRDITDRVKTEHELRLTEFCIDRASIGVMRIEADGRIAAVNQTVCENLGYTRDELLSMTVFDIDAVFTRETWLKNREQIRKRSSGTFESVQVRKDGTTCPVEVTVNYFTFNGKEYSFSFVRDITDRKAAEESLRVFQHSIEHAADAIFWMDNDGHYLYANREACRSLGYTLEELKRLSVWDIDPDSGKKNWHSEKDRYLKEGDRCGGYCIATHRRKDGTSFPVEVLASHFRFGDREIHMAFVRDITERVKAERELRFTQFCIDSSSIGVHQIDSEGRITMVNEFFCKNVGYTRDELCRMTIFDIDPWVDPDRWIEIRRRIKERGSDTFETQHRRKDGTLFPVEITTNYFPYRNEEYFFSFAVDITERKKSEEALRVFQYSIENAADAIYWLKPDGHYVYANRAACRSLGYSLDELKQMVLWQIDPDFGEKQWYIEIERSLREGDNYTGHFFTRHRRKDGTNFPVEVLAKHLFLGENEIHVAFARDITERVEAERELRVMQSCIDRASIGVHRVHPDGHLSMVNEHFCRNLGYTRDELIRMTVFDIDPFVGPDELAVIQRNIKERGSSIFETVHRRKDGTLFPVEITSFYLPYQGEDYLFSFAADITDRKAVEESLRLFQYSIDHAADAIFWMNREGRFTYANQQACHSLGYTLDELKQLVLWDIDPDYSEAMWYSELDRHLREGEKYTGHFLTIHRRKDGSVFPVEVLAKHLFFGEKEIHVAFVRDISERVKAEEALRERERLLKEAQEIANLGHYRLNIATGTWECSETLARIFGIGRDYPKDVDGWIHLMYPEDRDTMRDYLLHTVIREKHLFDRIYKIVRFADGEERWVHGLGRLEFDSDGNPTFMVGTLQDITERKQEEAEKANLEAQLVQAQKMESVGRLAGGVAHDFNNMLCVILGYVELMKDRLPKGDSLLKNLVEIEKAAVHSRDITRQLLAFSRKQIISPVPLDINQHIQDMKKTLSRLIGEDIQLHFHSGENLWRIRFDRAQFDQILMNLAVNARDAMPGGGHLTIETSNVDLDEAYCRGRLECEPGSYIQLVVSDNGIGMDKETLRNIFEPFFTTKEVGKGTGLGLATVYGIVKQNGGSISVYSEPGKGTTFKIYLPRLVDETEMNHVAKEIRPDRGSETVLLVEDDEMVRTMTKTMLEAMGYRVLVAENPSSAISICKRKETSIDLLFTDVVMPDMSGTELRSRIETIRPGLHVLFMSGYTTNVIVHHGVLEKGVHFIQKPFTMNDLSRKIREALGKR